MLLEMSQDIGEIKGQLNQALAGQKDTNDKIISFVKEVRDNHHVRINSLESDRTKVKGIAAFIGFVGAGVGTIVGFFLK